MTYTHGSFPLGELKKAQNFCKDDNNHKSFASTFCTRVNKLGMMY